jgi:hypothetical protein
LKQHCMVGSWLQSSSSRWYDSSLLPKEPPEGDHTELENEAKEPLPLPGMDAEETPP